MERIAGRNIIKTAIIGLGLGLGLLAVISFCIGCSENILDSLQEDANPESPDLTLTILNDGNGTTEPSGQITVKQDEPLDITAFPNINFNFIEWDIISGTGINFYNSNQSPTTVTLTSGNATIEADFENTSISGRLTINEVTGGTTNPPPGKIFVLFDTPKEVQAIPDENFHFSYWDVLVEETLSSVDVHNIDFASFNERNTSVILYSGESTIEPVFKCFLNVTSSLGGQITSSIEQEVFPYEPIKISAKVGLEGYYFAGWTVTSGTGVVFEDANSPSTTVLLMGGNATIQANFTNQYQLTVTLNDKYGGKVSPEGTQSVDYGKVISISATAANDYQFTSWVISPADSVDTDHPGFDASNSTTEIKVTGDVTVEAIFSEIINTCLLTVTDDGHGGTRPSSPPDITVGKGDKTMIYAKPDENWTFLNWTGAGATFGDANSPETWVIINADTIVTANFIDSWDLTVTSGSGGYVSKPGEGTYTVKNGGVVSLTAVPDAGCGFSFWTEPAGTDVADTNSKETTVTVTGDATVTANFYYIKVIWPNGSIYKPFPQEQILYINDIEYDFTWDTSLLVTDNVDIILYSSKGDEIVLKSKVTASQGIASFKLVPEDPRVTIYEGQYKIKIICIKNKTDIYDMSDTYFTVKKPK